MPQTEHVFGQEKTLDLTIDVFMGPSLLWFSAFSAVLAGLGRTLC